MAPYDSFAISGPVEDLQEVGKYRKKSRLLIVIQLCAVRLYGRFLLEVNDLSTRIISYLNGQLDLPPSLSIDIPDREATISGQRKNILSYLGFSKYNDEVQTRLKVWLEERAHQGLLPDELFLRTERFLLSDRVILPGAQTELSW